MWWGESELAPFQEVDLGGQDKPAGHLASDSVVVGRVKKPAGLVECSAPAPYMSCNLLPHVGLSYP